MPGFGDSASEEVIRLNEVMKVDSWSNRINVLIRDTRGLAISLPPRAHYGGKSCKYIVNIQPDVYKSGKEFTRAEFASILIMEF